MDVKVDLSTVKCVGEASCVGGKHPDPPLDGYPLLCWCSAHPVHESKVFTEDGKASVEDIGQSVSVSPSLEALAVRFGTTPDHVSQAISYALKAGFLKGE